MALRRDDPTTRAIARKGGLTRVRNEGGRRVAAPARAGFEAAIERAVDPEGVLSPEDRAQRAAAELRIRMADLARKRWGSKCGPGVSSDRHTVATTPRTRGANDEGRS